MSDQPFFKLCSEIDRLVSNAPSEKRIARFLAICSTSENIEQYAYGKLTDIAWIFPLYESGAFDRFGNSSEDRNAGFPQASYLQHVVRNGSHEYQRLVLNVLCDAAKKASPCLYGQFTEIAIYMQRECAACWAKILALAFKDKARVQGMFSDTYSRFIKKLADDGDICDSIELAFVILDVAPDPEAEAKRKRYGEETFSIDSIEPSLNCDRYFYQELLNEIIPYLSKMNPSKVLLKIADLLNKFVNYTVRDFEKKPYDGSLFFRPAVEEHEQNHDFETITHVVAAVRDAAEACCRTDKHRIPDVLSQLESFGWDIFRRIALHLLRVVEEVPAELIRERLVSRANLEYYAIHHEYSLLLKAKYGDLSKADQQQILAWTQEAYEEEKHKVDADPELTPQQRDTRMKYWLHRRLLILSDHLTGEWADRLADLNTELGDPEMPPEFLTWSGGGFVEQKSPADLPVLSSMSVTDLVRFLKEWTPTGDWRGPTPSGLGDALQKTVEADYTKYLSDIAQFEDIEIPPIYVRHFIAAFRKISLSLSDSQLTQLLALCEWVSKIPSDQPAPSAVGRLPRGLDFDSDWSHARRELANLMEALFPNDVTFPQQFKETAWGIIRTLTDDPEPTLEAENNESNFDDYTRLINSIRGIALNAMMRYAMWVCRNIKNTENRKAALADIPEVTQVLEDHLNSSRPFGNNRTDRALYGHWLPQLVSMDDEWVSRHVDAIFPNGIERRHLRWAAWESYLAYSQHVYRIVVERIRPIYEHEVEKLKGKIYEKDEPPSVDRRLAEHVMLISLFQDEHSIPNQLLSLFFESVPVSLAAHAMEYLGQQMHDNAEIFADQSLPLQALWSWRLRAVGGPDQISDKELASFGWWFASGILDEDWAFARMIEVLERTASSRASVEMFEYISEIFIRHPADSLRCVRLFIEHSADPWFFLSSRRRKGVWTILEQGLASQDNHIRAEAESLVHLLGSKGRLEFRELLQPSTAE